MATNVVRMVNSREFEQTRRFRWSEAFNAYWAEDTLTKRSHCMGDGVDMFCEAREDAEDPDEPDCLMPGTQRFYDALNAYFENEQQEIAECYFGVFLPDKERG